MKEYFAHFAHQTVNTDEFVKYFTEKFPGVAPLVDFDAWFHTPGQCPALAPIDMTLVTAASELASEWKDVCSTVPADKRAAALAAKFAEDAPAVRKWDSKQKQLFLSELRELVETEVDAAGECEWWDLVSCGRLTSLYELDADEDSEVRFLWCRIGLRAGRDESVEITKKFLAAYGRMKYVRPLFQDLHKVYPKGDMAKALFMERQGGYHDICNKMVARDLEIPILVADS